MNAGQLVLVVGDVVNLMKADGILLPNGDFDKTKLDTLEEDVQFAVQVEQLLEAHGLDNIPDRVKKLIEALPLIVGFIQ